MSSFADKHNSDMAAIKIINKLKEPIGKKRRISKGTLRSLIIGILLKNKERNGTFNNMNYCLIERI